MIFTVILSRADARNAVDRRTAELLADAFREFERDDSAAVAVLYGEGGVFCAGADLKAIADGDANHVDFNGDGPMGPTRMQLSKPVIAAIAGPAVAGGLEMALWCDLRVAEEDAQFGVLCRRFGVPLIDGGTVRLPRIIGLGNALDMILTGRLVAVQEAKAMGLVSRVVPVGTSRQEAELLGRQIATFPPICMRHDRLSTYEQIGVPIQQALENELRHGMAALEAEATEGAMSFRAGKGRGGSFEPPP